MNITKEEATIRLNLVIQLMERGDGKDEIDGGTGLPDILFHELMNYRETLKSFIKPYLDGPEI